MEIINGIRGIKRTKNYLLGSLVKKNEDRNFLETEFSLISGQRGIVGARRTRYYNANVETTLWFLGVVVP